MSINALNNKFCANILIVGDDAFEQEIRKQLKIIYSTSIGKELIESLSSKKIVRILAGKLCLQQGNDIVFNFDEVHGTLELGRTAFGEKKLFRPDDSVSLFHELVHIWLYQNDILFDGRLLPDDRLYVDKNEELCITGKTGNVTVKFFENALLEEIDHPMQRISWIGIKLEKLSSHPINHRYQSSFIHDFSRLGLVKGYLDKYEPLLLNFHILDDSESTPLHYAAYCSHEAAAFLLTMGLSLNDRNRYDFTPFTIAVNQNNLEIIELFLNFGISIDSQKVVRKKSIFEYCCSLEMEQALLKAGFSKD